jgi:hypothetical protein
MAQLDAITDREILQMVAGFDLTVDYGAGR